MSWIYKEFSKDSSDVGCFVFRKLVGATCREIVWRVLSNISWYVFRECGSGVVGIVDFSVQKVALRDRGIIIENLPWDWLSIGNFYIVKNAGKHIKNPQNHNIEEISVFRTVKIESNTER